MTRSAIAAAPVREELETMVAEADTGGRKPTGFSKTIIFAVALAWSLFQLWYASPLPFTFNFGVFNDSQARVIHLSFAFLLAFATFPAFKSSPRDRIPIYDWVLADPRRAAACYLHRVLPGDIALRPGLPTTADIVISVIGVVLLLEAARRAVGPALAVIASHHAGLHLRRALAARHARRTRARRLSRVASQMWLTSEGIFGVALGVSTSVVFLFVLFGSLLEKAGAGNYFIQLAFAMLGTFRGGPAKAGVVASGMTGMISGSSVANTVTTGTFTIPLMKRVGYSAGEGRRDRVRRRRQRPVDAAGDGRGGVPDRRICRHHLRRSGQARLPAGVPHLRRAVLHRRYRGREARACAACRDRRRCRCAQSLMRALMTVCGIIILSGIVY